MKRRHADEKLLCDYCKEKFSSKISTAKDSRWDEFRTHVYKVQLFFPFADINVCRLVSDFFVRAASHVCFPLKQFVSEKAPC